MADRAECEQIVRQLWPYLDGALPDEWQARVPELWRERVVEHLEHCDGCRSHFDFEREFLVAVHAAVNTEGEFEELKDRVLSALVQDGLQVR